MSRIHFLNVNDGDCSIIQHNSGRITVIDVSAAKPPAKKLAESSIRMSAFESLVAGLRESSKSAGVSGNFNRSEYPDNPISYMKNHGINDVFRFICSHPDMDHLDGIKSLFQAFKPTNFWDTNNTKEIEEFEPGRYDPADWEFYTNLRDKNPQDDPKRLCLFAGATGQYYNRNENGESGDGLQVLAPTAELVHAANEAGDWNDSSYVILYRTAGGKRILFPGDSHDATWEHVINNYSSEVAKVDVLIAPHHGRDSGRDHGFLDVVKPRLTLFGNAPSEHLAYDEWNNRDLMFLTNNQAGSIIMNIEDNYLDVFVSHEEYARSFVNKRPYLTRYCDSNKGWFIGRWS